MEEWIVLGLILCLGVYSGAENTYGDKGVVLTALQFQNAGGFDDFNTIKSRPGPPLVNDSAAFPGFNFDNLNDQFLSCAVDYDMNYLYIYDYTGRDITLLENFNSSAIKKAMTKSRVHGAVSQEYSKLAVDWLSHNIYWTDPVMGRIAMQKGGPTNSSQNFKTIIAKLDLPRGIAIDPLAGKIFWTDFIQGNEGSAKIESASLTGQNRMIIRRSKLREPLAIAADPSTQRIYYVDGYHIESSNYDGTDTITLIRYSKASFFDIAIFENVILATDNRAFYLHFFDKTTGKVLRTKAGSITEADFGICVYDNPDRGTATDQCSTMSCDHICVNEPNRVTCLCYDGYNLVAGTNGQMTKCQESSVDYLHALIVSTKKDLCKVLMSVLVSDEEVTPVCFYIGDEGETIDFIDLNMERRLVYFVINTTIYSVPIDGGPNRRSELTRQTRPITGMTYDWHNDHIYYALSGDDTTAEAIYILEPESGQTQPRQLKTGARPRNLVVSPHQGNLYYLAGVDELETSKLNVVKNETTKITLDAPFINPIHMHHDVKYEMLFVLDDTSALFGSKDITGLHYNGTVEEYHILKDTVIDVVFYQEFIVLLERPDGTNKTKIVSADYALGSPFTPMATGTIVGIDPVYNIMVLNKEELQPAYASPCGNIKEFGGCEDLCIPEGETSQCECQFGSTLAADGKSCESSPVSDNFILLSDITYNDVLQISLDDPTKISQIRGVNALGRPHGVMYNYMTDRVIWASYSNSQVWGINLNGTFSNLISNTDELDSYPDRFALDPSTGTVYYTGVYYYTDEQYSFIGVLDTATGADNVLEYFGQNPRALRLHPRKGLMFWTDYGTKPFIARANMDGSAMTEIVTEDITWPNGLAIDYADDRLYWTDGFLNKIFSCDFNGENRVMLLEDAGAHLQDMVMMDNYLYYTAWDKLYITKVHKSDTTDKTHIGPAHGLGRIHALDIYSSTASVKTPVNLACQTNNGGCSHFCFPMPTGNKCGCDWWNGLLPDDKNCENAPRCAPYIGAATLGDDSECLRLLGSRCTYKCADNYIQKPTAPTHVVCVADSLSFTGLSWDGSNLCEEILCPVLENVILPSNCRRSVDDDCSQFMCPRGYEINEAVTSLKCNAGGTWSQAVPLCIEKCPAFTNAREHGSLAASCSRQPGTSCQFTCMARYRYASSKKSVDCVSGSRWNATTSSLCEVIKCKDYFENGIVNETCSLAVGAVCQYHCYDRFEPNPNIASITCKSEGVWNIGGGLCIGQPVAGAQKQSNQARNIGLGVGLTVLFLIILAVIVLFFLYRRGKLPISANSTPSKSTTSFENPRYTENSVNIQPSSGTEANRDFGYATLEDDTADLTKDSWAKTQQEAARTTNPLYDNSPAVLQP